MSRLSLFGAIHFDRRAKVEDELSEFVATEDADAIFIEWPEHALARRAVLRAIVAVPIVVLGGVVLDLVRSPYYLLFNRRFDSTEHVIAERIERPTHEIDRHPWALMAEAGLLAIALNWLVGLAFLAVAPFETTATTVALLVAGGAVRAAATRDRSFAAVAGTLVLVALGSIGAVVDPFIGWFALILTALPAATAVPLAFSMNTTIATVARIPAVAVVVTMAFLADSTVGWFALVAFLAFAVFATRTLDTRNEHMTERIETIAGEEGYDSSVLVTGAAHLPGIVERASDAGLALGRTYTPRWLRAPGKIEENPAESAESAVRTSDTVPVELGSAGARAAASVVDLLVLGAMAQLLLDGFLSGVLAGIIVTPLAYYVLLEAHYGKTLGKHLEGLVVTDRNGLPPSLRACLLRNLLRPVDFVAFYLLGFVVVLATDRDQRLGDLVAGTEIRVRS
ncbi:RDD family protein [Halococcus sediminicola]|uniref:RDD family protein n=1 Tax=Halococcus sediminicola TaxID=1264579 RepID=UPI000679401D|nr:RDD family protein [Halococcus sediminicola]